jgi:hypothetical protein
MEDASNIEFPIRGVYADLVTALGFKPMESTEKWFGGFDSHPLPLVLDFPTRQNLISHLIFSGLRGFFMSGLLLPLGRCRIVCRICCRIVCRICCRIVSDLVCSSSEFNHQGRHNADSNQSHLSGQTSKTDR